MNPNADCLIITPTHTSSATLAGQTTVTYVEATTPLRCWAMPVSSRTMEGVTGEVGITGYRVRLHTTQDIAAGWPIKLKLDGETAYVKYMVREAGKHPLMGHTRLTVEKV